MFAANETVPKSGRVEQDALQDIQAGRSSTRWFGAGGGALWAAALHSMVRWEERRGTAGGSGPAVLEPSASTMSAPKGEGGGEGGSAGPAAPGGPHGRRTGTIPTRFPMRKRDPRAGSPGLPPAGGSGTVLPAGGCGTGRHHRGREGGEGATRGRVEEVLSPPAFPPSRSPPAARQLLRPVWHRCVPGVWAAGAPGTGLTGSPGRLSHSRVSPTASSPLGASDRGAASLGLIAGRSA